MAGLYQYTLWLHAVAGLIGLVLFWIPVALRKGSPRHKRIGGFYLRLMLVSGFTGLLMAILLLLNPIAAKFPVHNYTPDQLENIAAAIRHQGWFFLLLAFLVLSTTQRAKQSLVARANRDLLRTPFALAAPVALLAVSLIVGWLAITQSSILSGVFCGIGLSLGSGLLWYAYKPTLKRNEWVIEHLSATIASGIASHTAFFAFGGARLLGELFGDNYALIPWIAPGVIGGVAITVVKRRYQRRFGHIGGGAGAGIAKVSLDAPG